MTAIDLLITSVTSVIAESSLFALILGTILLMAGLVILVMQLAIIVSAYRTTGRVVGGYEKTKIKRKQRNGDTVEKQKTTLFAVYEYTRKNGELCQTLSSDGGSYVKTLQTDATVDIRVWEHSDYDDVYLTKNRSPWWMAMSLISAGIVILVVAGNVLATVGMSLMSFGLILVGLLVRLIRTTRSSSEQTQHQEHHKYFEPNEIKPIESFQ